MSDASGTAAQAAGDAADDAATTTPASAGDVPQDRFDGEGSALAYAEELAAEPADSVINSPTESQEV